MYAQIKRNKWNELCTSLDSRSSNGKLWRLVKNVGNEQPQVDICNTVQNKDGKIARDDFEAANIFGLHYQNTSRLNFTTDDRHIKVKASKIVHGCRSNPQGGIAIFHRDFCMQELEAAINDTNLNTSPGPDGIHGQMIVNLGKDGRQRFLDIINGSWNSGRLPREWRRAIVVPLRKSCQDSTSPDNYRPIALTCIACKVMEKMILKRLTFYLNYHNLLPKEQFGFREGHSTTDQMLYFSQKIRDAHNMKPTNHTIAAFLDLSKAFDRVWKQKLIIKLFQDFGISGKALPWIYDFLRNRIIRVRFNNTLSKSFKLHQGVPQGSVLSPTLFTLFLSGIEQIITKRCEAGLFADDIVLWNSGTDLKNLENNINFTLNDVCDFANRHKLIFNPIKSTVGFFTTNRKLYNYRPKIFLNQQPLAVEKHPKYLGFVLDPEILSNKHIDHLVLRARKRLNILKYISGRDWGADASTLRNTYISLIRPILEYGLPVYCCASNTNLQKLERVQLSAARIITGLRNTCPNDIVLYEADLQPLGLRRNACLTKYFNKLYGLGTQNRTSNFLINWCNNQRLRRSSPFSHVTANHLFASTVEHHHLTQCIDPSEGLPNIYFHTNLPVRVNKKNDLPVYLRQIALERIHNIPENAVKMYTDGSRSYSDRSGSGIYIVSNSCELKIQRRNPDFCSVFRSELVAINEGLELLQSLNDNNEIWILSDSRSSIQHLENWQSVRDNVSVSILSKLKRLSLDHQVHFQWIPSHVDLEGNEIADTLAKAGSYENTVSPGSLTYLELFSKVKCKNNSSWSIPPVHYWYQSDSPGGSLALRCNRHDQTTLTRFLSGHLRTLTYSGDSKCFATCTKCSSEQASPKHILQCLGLTRQDLFSNPLMVLDFFRVYGIMDLI